MSRSAFHELDRRELGPGYSVPRIISGGWQLSQGHRQTVLNPDSAVREMRRLADAGLTAFDCGDIYVGVEALLGKLRQVSADVRVHTKFVPDRDELPHIDRRHVERIIDRSLRRLCVERLDLVQFAWWDYGVQRYVETAGWLDEQRRAGKIRLLSLLDRRPERGMLSFCGEHGIHLLAYGTLGGGFLSERYLDRPDPELPLANRSLVKYRLMIDEFGGWARFQDLLGALAPIASRHAVSIANVAVRWTLERPGVAAAIIGAFDARHLDDNLRVFGFELDREDLERLEPFEDAGPDQDVYTAERRGDGQHAAIMKYNLNREASD